MRSFVARLLRSALQPLIAFGHIWVYMPPASPEEALSGPAPGHPETLRSDIPPSAVEQALHRQLTDLTPEEGRELWQ
ncbi:DUF6059 family protein [Streptomyces sp. NPDC006617]|uniref:DUF6059 family protein n=1 Tax=Streptomyces sp. NPDC006617 TaxID=3155354 RepID=UPI0033B704FB